MDIFEALNRIHSIPILLFARPTYKEQRYAREITPNIAITMEAYLRAEDYDRSHHTARGYERRRLLDSPPRSYTLHRSSRAIRGMRRRHAEVVPNEQSESECSPDA